MDFPILTTWTFTNPFEVTNKIRVGNGNKLAGENQSLFLYGSNDGTNWTVVDDILPVLTMKQAGQAGRAFLPLVNCSL